MIPSLVKMSPLHILIVEDEHALALLEKNLLEQNGYSVIGTAESAHEAYSLIESFIPDIILMDINLKGFETGIDLAQKIRLKMDVPVIFISSEEDLENLAAFKESGFYGFLCKPIREYELIAAIESAHVRHIAEKKLRYSEQKYRFIFETIQDVYFETDMNGIVLEMSPSIRTLSGYAREDVLGKPLFFILGNEPDFRAALRIITEMGHGFSHDVVINRKDGSVSSCDVRGVTAVTKTGVPLKIVGTIMDTSVRMEIEERVNTASREYELLINSLSSVIIGVSTRDIVTHWNREAELVFKTEAKEAIGKKITSVCIDWKAEDVYEGIADAIIMNKPVVVNEVEFHNAGDPLHTRFLKIRITPLRVEDGTLRGFLLACDDITEKRAMRIRFHQIQKMEAIGQLAAGIAHEINTPTQYISDNTLFVKNSFESLLPAVDFFSHLENSPDSRITEYHAELVKLDLPFLIKEIPAALEQTMDGISRISKIVGSMKQFSHPGKQEKTLYDINQIINDAVTISKNEWKYAAELTTELDASIPAFACYPNALGQVFLIMIINAAHAIEEKNLQTPEVKGIIHISSRATTGKIFINIKDTGNGIPDAIKEKIFDPFFTTKEVGKGTGQGLSIAHSVIYEMHNGEIDVSSKSGQGTVFIITLPIEEIIAAAEGNNEV